MLDHERLDVYQRAIELLALAFAVADRVPRGYASLGDQLRRAAMSIPLNIAEASGKPDGPDRRRFHAIARGSAMECAAILDVARLLADPPLATLMEAKTLLIRIVEMLSRVVPLTDHLAPRLVCTRTRTCHEDEDVHEYDVRVRGCPSGLPR